MVDFAHVDALATGYHQRGGQPGLAYGIVAGGELVHAGGLGVRYRPTTRGATASRARGRCPRLSTRAGRLV